MTDYSDVGVRIRRLLAEGVTVVVSILIAFALDAWWEQRQLEDEMREDLAIVETELAENVRLIDFNLDLMDRVITASSSITEALFSDPGATEVELPGEWLYWGIFVNPTLDLSLGAIDAWIATGRLAGIDDPGLRKRLASVRGKVADVTEEQEVARDVGTRDLYPYLAETGGDVRPIVAMFEGGLPTLRRRARIPGDRQRLQTSALQRQQELLQRVDTEHPAHRVLPQLAVRAVGDHAVLAVAAQEARLHPVVLEACVVEVPEHRLRGGRLHGQVVVRAAPGAELGLVAVRTGGSADIAGIIAGGCGTERTPEQRTQRDGQ